MPPSSTNPAVDSVPSAAVVEQLTRIVNSPDFISSAGICRFLTHIVNRTVDGDLDSLKEFSIAMEVFNRTSDYDPKIDALVRVEARRLRAKLKAYYEDPGKHDPVLIALRSGSYVPMFRWLDKPVKEREEVAGAVRPSVAVLPFVNMSPDPDQDYFCDGMSEEIVTSLTRVAGLKVIARTSSFQFKGTSVDIRELGRRLDADLIIEGSVRKAGEQLRITAQAIETESGHHIWAETYRRELKDVFAIQEEIAQSVANLLELHMPETTARQRSSVQNLEAYTKFLRAKFLIHQQSPETLHAALQQLREIIEAFPDYASAYSGIAAANSILSVFGIVSGRDVYQESKATAERGYALDPNLADTCTMLAAVRSVFEYRWTEAEMLCNRAIQIQPGHSAAYVVRGLALLCQGNSSGAEAALRHSTELDPLSAGDYVRLAYVHYIQGDYRSAADDLQRCFDLHRDFPIGRFYEALMHYQQENYEDVIEYLSRSGFPLDIGLRAAAYAQKGSKSGTKQCLEKLKELSAIRYVTPLAEGLAAIGMEDFDLAFQRMDEAIEHKTNFINMLAVEPFFNPLRGEARFNTLLKKLNLSA